MNWQDECRVEVTRIAEINYIGFARKMILRSRISVIGPENISSVPSNFRDSIGDCGLIGDKRWSGTYGVNVSFVALEVY